jgi:hypothetical protein
MEEDEVVEGLWRDENVLGVRLVRYFEVKKCACGVFFFFFFDSFHLIVQEGVLRSFEE